MSFDDASSDMSATDTDRCRRPRRHCQRESSVYLDKIRNTNVSTGCHHSFNEIISYIHKVTSKDKSLQIKIENDICDLKTDTSLNKKDIDQIKKCCRNQFLIYDNNIKALNNANEKRNNQVKQRIQEFKEKLDKDKSEADIKFYNSLERLDLYHEHLTNVKEQIESERRALALRKEERDRANEYLEKKVETIREDTLYVKSRLQELNTTSDEIAKLLKQVQSMDTKQRSLEWSFEKCKEVLIKHVANVKTKQENNIEKCENNRRRINAAIGRVRSLQTTIENQQKNNNLDARKNSKPFNNLKRQVNRLKTKLDLVRASNHTKSKALKMSSYDTVVESMIKHHCKADNEEIKLQIKDIIIKLNETQQSNQLTKEELATMKIEMLDIFKNQQDIDHEMEMVIKRTDYHGIAIKEIQREFNQMKSDNQFIIHNEIKDSMIQIKVDNKELKKSQNELKSNVLNIENDVDVKHKDMEYRLNHQNDQINAIDSKITTTTQDFLLNLEVVKSEQEKITHQLQEQNPEELVAMKEQLTLIAPHVENIIKYQEKEKNKIGEVKDDISHVVLKVEEMLEQQKETFDNVKDIREKHKAIENKFEVMQVKQIQNDQRLDAIETEHRQAIKAVTDKANNLEKENIELKKQVTEMQSMINNIKESQSNQFTQQPSIGMDDSAAIYSIISEMKNEIEALKENQQSKVEHPKIDSTPDKPVGEKISDFNSSVTEIQNNRDESESRPTTDERLEQLQEDILECKRDYIRMDLRLNQSNEDFNSIYEKLLNVLV